MRTSLAILLILICVLTVPFTPAKALTITDTSPWEERATWWDREWRYRVSIDVTAPEGIPLYDKLMIMPLDWSEIFSNLGISDKTLDTDSIRVVEYTPGGHIHYRQSNNINRFDTMPAAVYGSNNSTLEFLMAGETTAGETRRFFVYFDTTDNDKATKDYHYLTQTTGTGYQYASRTGPDTESVAGGTNIAVQSWDTNQSTDHNLLRNQPSFNGSSWMVYPYSGFVTGSNYKGIKTASQTTTVRPSSVMITSSLTGYDPGSGPEMSGTETKRLHHMFLGASQIGVATADVTITVNADTSSGAIIPALGYLRSGTTTNTWYTNADGTVVNHAANATAYDMYDGDHTLIMTNNSSLTHALMIRDFSYNSSAFNYGNFYTYNSHPWNYIRFGNTTNQTFKAGDTFSYTYTYIVSSSQLSYDTLAPALHSLNASPTTTVGEAVAYSDDLHFAQLLYFENEAWDYVINTLAQNGWGEPWNIVYEYDLDTGIKQFDHDQDSTMGAGFILYAASLKAAMTGEQRFYEIADKYANYMIQLEAKDVEQHGSDVAGRIAYFYNGSNSVTYLNTPPGQVKDLTSIDQMTTALWGLWMYYHLDPSKIAYENEAGGLIRRAHTYIQTIDPTFKNILPALGESDDWYTSVRDYSENGSSAYRDWIVENETSPFVTGGEANSFFVGSAVDRLHPSKSLAEMEDKIEGLVADGATSGREFYSLTNRNYYTSSWGYTWDEFIKGWHFQVSGAHPLLYDNSKNPTHYGSLSTVSSNRDSLEGRTSHVAAMVGYAAAQNPEGRIKVDGSFNKLMSDHLEDMIHVLNGLIMTDDGSMRVTYKGTLGKFGGVTESKITSSFSGFYLTSLAFYNILHKNVANPFPLGKMDFITGISENDGVVTLKYLGDITIDQDVIFPRTDKAVFTTGVLTPPTVTFDSTGTITELSDKILTFSVPLVFKEVKEATVQQTGLTVQPNSGTVEVNISEWNDQRKTWEESGTGVTAAEHTITDLEPATSYQVQVDGSLYQTVTSDNSGSVTFDYTGGYSTKTFALVKVSEESFNSTSNNTDTNSSHTALSEGTSNSSPVCSFISPHAAPQLLSLVSGMTTVQLYWSPVNDNTDSYAIEYGTNSGEYQWGVSSVPGKETTKFLIGSLKPNTKYFFRMRAGNGCATGPWSAESAIITRSFWTRDSITVTDVSVGGLTNPEVFSSLPQSENSELRAPTSPQIEVQSYSLTLTIKNSHQQPIQGARISLHSDAKEGITDEKGQVTFDNVEKGEHQLTIVHNSYRGEQVISVAGDSSHIELDITIEPVALYQQPLLITVIASLTLVSIVIALVLLFKKR